MLLSVYDRLILLNILPAEGDITTIRIIRDLRAELSFSEEEHQALQFKQNGPEVKWINEADKPKEVNIGIKASQIIEESFLKLNAQKKLTEAHIPIYEKFVSKDKD